MWHWPGTGKKLNGEWRFLVDVLRLAKHAKLGLDDFFGLKFCKSFVVNRLVPQDKMSVLANQATLHSWGVNMGRLTSRGCWLW